MVGIIELWLPILLAAVLVFVASSILHMVLRYHWSDWAAMPGEDKVRAALSDVAPGKLQFAEVFTTLRPPGKVVVRVISVWVSSPRFVIR